jgi:hypothetical protein
LENSPNGIERDAFSIRGIESIKQNRPSHCVKGGFEVQPAVELLWADVAFQIDWLRGSEVVAGVYVIIND